MASYETTLMRDTYAYEQSNAKLSVSFTVRYP